MGQILLFPLRRKAGGGFLRPKNATASAGFEPANLGARGTLTICNTYCFSTATVVTRTRLNVKLYVHGLSGITLRTQWNKPRSKSIYKREEGSVQMHLLITDREYLFCRDNRKKN